MEVCGQGRGIERPASLTRVLSPAGEGLGMRGTRQRTWNFAH